MQRSSVVRAGDARRPRPLLLLALTVTAAVLASDARASRSTPSPLPAQLEALARELQERAAHAAGEREALSAHLASSQQLLGELFASEKKEVELFAQATRARMQQLRGELGDELARASGDVARRVTAAVRNVSALVRRREAARREGEKQLCALKAARNAQNQKEGEGVEVATRRQQQEEEEEEEKEREGAQDEEEATQSVEEQAENATSGAHEASADEMETPRLLASAWATAADATRWLWSLVLTALLEAWRVFWRWVVPAVLVFGGVLLAAIAVVKFIQYQRAKRRKKGVLYSGYLKPRHPKKQQLERRRRCPVGAIQSATLPVSKREERGHPQSAPRTEERIG